MKTEHEIREEIRSLKTELAMGNRKRLAVANLEGMIDALEYVLSGPLALTPLDEIAMRVAAGAHWCTREDDATMCERVYQIAESLLAEGKRRREASGGNANH